MIDLSRHSVLLYDLSGAYTHIAEAMVPAFGRVLYSSHWEASFANVEDFLPGIGLEGIERVPDPFEHFDTVDLVVFPDVGMNGLQEFLRKRGMPVWGSGAAGKIERDRVFFKKLLEEQDMDVPEYEVIHGMKALREYLDKHEDVYVKVSYFRGLTETFHHESEFLSRRKLDEIASVLGLYGEMVDFVVEQTIGGDAVESGIDGYAVNGLFPQRLMWGYELKDKGYIQTVSDLPAPLRETVDQFQPVLQSYQYRGPFATEVRFTEDGAYFIDPTCRFPSPPGEIQAKNIKNLAEIMYQGARGILVEPQYFCRFAAQIILKSRILETGATLPVQVGMPDNVLLHGHFRLNGEDYVILPGARTSSEQEEFAGAIGLADTLEEAAGIACEAAQSVKGEKVVFDEDALLKIIDTIQEGEKLGLSWGEFSGEVKYAS